MYSILTIPELEPFLVNHIGGTLQSLLRKTDLIEGSQLELDWRPLYDLTERFMFSNYEALGLIKIPQSLPATIKSVVKVCRFANFAHDLPVFQQIRMSRIAKRNFFHDSGLENLFKLFIKLPVTFVLVSK